MNDATLRRTDSRIAALCGEDPSSPRRLRLVALAALFLHAALFFVRFPERPAAPPPPEPPPRWVLTVISMPKPPRPPEFPREEAPPPAVRMPVPSMEERPVEPVREEAVFPADASDAAWTPAVGFPQGPPPPRWMDGDAVPPGGTAPVKIHHVEPAYPPDALRMGLEGTVTLRLRVDEDGRVFSAEVIRPGPLPSFAGAAVEAAMKWRYAPAVYRGVPVSSSLTATVQFTLR